MSRTRGQDVEALAAKFLTDKGLSIIERNYQCRAGEIDLICLDNQQLIFVEVRYRKSAKFGNAAESVTAKKQQRILMTAQHFLINHRKLQNLSCRFDVIACRPTEISVAIDWIKGAFTA